ncbi:hypothetical protein LDG_5310 [Legionella drancourtii LLAP12]|uniref:Uncharacterized protein n=1 Tax=Legionella drancourtii LLAP12 TaxID=658187 RepID=G9EJE8_9GAMM|nr:hypothetical protein LDG_5310 [Legionella drancourtii LLAP12]
MLHNLCFIVAIIHEILFVSFVVFLSIRLCNEPYCDGW